MNADTELKKQLLDALAKTADPTLIEARFNRRKGSLVFVRVQKNAKHEIAFVVDWSPKYQPDAEAHIHPMVRVSIPEVSKQALQLVRGNKLLLGGAPDIIVNQPIDFSAPKSAYVRWFATGKEQFEERCHGIAAFIVQWVMPLLADFASAGDLITLYETSDARVMKQRHWFVFVAAAYQLEGRSESARKLIEEQFGSPGMRKRYAPLFESIGVS